MTNWISKHFFSGQLVPPERDCSHLEGTEHCYHFLVDLEIVESDSSSKSSLFHPTESKYAASFTIGTYTSLKSKLVPLLQMMTKSSSTVPLKKDFIIALSASSKSFRSLFTTLDHTKSHMRSLVGTHANRPPRRAKALLLACHNHHYQILRAHIWRGNPWKIEPLVPFDFFDWASLPLFPGKQKFKI